MDIAPKVSVKTPSYKPVKLLKPRSYPGTKSNTKANMNSDRAFPDTLVRWSKSTMLTYNMAILCVYSHYFDQLSLPHPVLALLLSCMAGVGFLVIGKLLTLWESTRESGDVLLKRVRNCQENWELHTLRSSLEVHAECLTLFLLLFDLLFRFENLFIPSTPYYSTVGGWLSRGIRLSFLTISCAHSCSVVCAVA